VADSGVNPVREAHANDMVGLQIRGAGIMIIISYS